MRLCFEVVTVVIHAKEATERVAGNAEGQKLVRPKKKKKEEEKDEKNLVAARHILFAAGGLKAEPSY